MGAFIGGFSGASEGRRSALEALRRRTRFTALAPLVAVALHLPCELFGGLVERVRHVRRRGARAERDALEVKGALDDLRVDDGGVALLAELDVEAGEIGDLPPDLREALLRALPEIVRDEGVPPLDLDVHRVPFR